MPRAISRFPGALAAAALLALAAGGCDHATDPDGPSLVDRFGPFNVVEPLSASETAVAFADGGAVTFAARFNKRTDWVLEIVGQQSGAVRRIEGSSNELTAENARWTGRTTTLPLFKAEPVTARLFFPDEPGSDTTAVDLAVLSPRAYPGVVVADFEAPSSAVRVGNFEFEFRGAGISAEVPPGQGNGFFLLRGVEPPSGPTRNFFVGLIDILSRPTGTPFAVPTTVPEDLYLNFFIRGFGTPNTIAVVQLIADVNGNGVFNDGADTVFEVYNQPVDFEGWRPVAVRASTAGLNQTQAGQLVAVRVLLISDNTNQPATPLPVDFGIDYVTFTAGGPLEL